jgi:hypothetical protein
MRRQAARPLTAAEITAQVLAAKATITVASEMCPQQIVRNVFDWWGFAARTVASYCSPPTPKGTLMKLFYAPGACSLSPHIVLFEAGIPFEVSRLDFATRKTAEGEDYYAINPKGAVPALRLDNGEVLTEGAVIVQYIADKAGNTSLAPAAGTPERMRLQEWLNYIASEIHKGFSPLFNPKTPDE